MKKSFCAKLPRILRLGRGFTSLISHISSLCGKSIASCALLFGFDLTVIQCPSTNASRTARAVSHRPSIFLSIPTACPVTKSRTCSEM
jgi:hypothetical protein